jgi:hypothetical protein
MSEEQLQALKILPVAETCRLIDFECITIAVLDRHCLVKLDHGLFC